MSEDEIAVTIGLQKQKRNIQVGILAVLAFFGSYAILFSDSHNDRRYVLIEAYAKDRSADNLLHAQEVASFQRQFTDHTDTLKEIKTDVKSILHDVPNKIDNLNRRTKYQESHP